MPLFVYLTRLFWLCALPLLLFAAWLVFDSVQTLQTENEKQAQHIASNLATAIDHHLSARIGALNVMSASPLADHPGRWADFYKVAQGFHTHFNSHVIFAEAAAPRRMIFNTRLPYGEALPNLPAPRGGAATGMPASGEARVTDVFVGPLAGVPLIAMTVPLVRERAVTHLLVATYETQHFQVRLDQVKLPADWRLVLLDSQGQTIAQRQPLGLSAADAAEVAWSTTLPLHVAPWSVRLEIPRAVYFSPLWSAAMALGLGVLSTTLLGFAGSAWVSRRLARAMSSLANDQGMASGGDPDIAEVEAVRQRILAANARIDSFAGEQERAIEQERRRVAREVHDQLGQVFTAIRLIVRSIPRAAYPPGQAAALEQALDMGITSARKITAELRPPLLDDLGLEAALTHYASEISRQGGLSCTVDLRETEKITATQAIALFRIVQEAVTNVLRHAGASAVHIQGASEEARYRLSIADNGRGFSPASLREGAMGLLNMRERARLLQGECTIEALSAGGTVVTVLLPVLPPSSESSA